MAEPSILGALRDPQFRSDTLRNLVEALNGAKRSLTVGSLGAVGDMGNTLANLVRAGAGTAYHEATGRPIPQALEYRDPARDFGTSASLGNFAEQQGWLPPQTGSIPETAGALLGPIAAMKAPDLAQSTLRGLVSALKSEPSRRMVEGYMSGMGMKPQAIVYHGSPHQFDAFDSSKIGTGEGAQAYGHGLYLAESPNVAKSYQDELAGRGYRASIVQNGRNSYSVVNPNGVVLADGVMLGQAHRAKSAHDAAQTGSLYKVDLPDPLIARMLDWDKPLSQQPKAAQSFFADVNRAPEESQALGEWLQPRMREGMAPYWSDDLRKAGIPGIRYLDGGSRADGAGTSNFVVFPGEESALTILERNGKPVPLRDLLKGPAEATQFPQDAALATAHRNGVDMLGLPENHTPMDRARALGFDMNEYHGTGAGEFAAFDPQKMRDNVQYGGSIYTTKDPNFASRIADSKWSGDQPTVMPLLIRGGKRFDMDAPISAVDAAGIIREAGQSARADKIAEIGKPYRNGSELFYFGIDPGMSNPARGAAINRAGFDVITGDPSVEIMGVPGKPQTAIFDPSRIRSRFAAFDPARRNESDLLASFAGAGILSPLVLEQLADPRDKKDKPRR